ncbi:uncharacterized protein EV154DRAFT_583071, partial [Mucor mucedo]|uniref:uncharacterized protein n=1 Tax=Mucor mucedo TaxID=29922 RepID=UPI00221E39FD
MKNNTREFDNENLHRSLSVKEKIVLCVSATTQCTNKSKSIFGGLQHQYLCYMQGTSYAVTPIHTDEEVKLYEQLRKHNPSLVSQAVSEQCWQDFTILWSRECNKGITKNIFYKLPENLRQYFKERENQSRYLNSVLLNKETVDTATELIQKSQQKISLGKATDFLQFPNQTSRDDTNQIHMKNSTPSSPRYKKTSMLLKPRTQKSM